MWGLLRAEPSLGHWAACLSPTPPFPVRMGATKFFRALGLRVMSVMNTADDVVTYRTLGFSILGESEHTWFSGGMAA